MNGFLKWLIHGPNGPKTVAQRRAEERDALARQVEILRAGPINPRDGSPHLPQLAEELSLALSEMGRDPAYRQPCEQNERKAALDALLEAGDPLDATHERLAAFEWDWRGSPIIVVTADHIRRVLVRWRASEIDESWVEQWANLVEVREDLALEDGDQGAVAHALHTLANPALHGALTPQLAQDLEARLTAASRL